MMKRVWMITGAGKGIGYSIARAALEAGNYVVAATRKENDFSAPQGYEKNTLNLRLDVSDLNAAVYKSAVQKAVSRFGRIDVLVNNAGHGRITNFEETSEDNIRELFEVNFFGMLRVTRSVLPVMRKQRSGHIFNIASGAGYAPGPVVYHSSKFAVTGFSTSLAFEVAPFGIKVTNVVPGMVRTSFYDKGNMCMEPDISIADYDENRWQDDFMQANSHHEQTGDPDKIAKLIVEVSDMQDAPLHLPVTADAVETLKNWQKGIEKDIEVWGKQAAKTTVDN
ncbi:MAG TPA: SDR family oxidoreductase [Candidatus Avidehalobacter gallistercoris]|uniref:SDR family oxidoreductase n=1 Tax=Candidatus Avidehalobacter gallistercoris TaxID=2840694 RepID=A0A9D1HKA8_9FIRM|nr:SDR family oxidoreductase [Candidatus Avidehalobacter gallistercoris]